MDPHQLQPYRPQAQPPEETGRRLATFRRGRDAELHVCLAEYEGSPFISLRVWERGSDGRLWPARGKGCSVRLAEAGELAEALAAVAEAHRDRGGRRGSSTWYQAPERRQDRRPPQRSLPGPKAPSGPKREFDEFDGGDAP
jgi:hypothetical protein